MKLKKLFSTYLMVILFGGMVLGFGLPREANAICIVNGYVVSSIQLGGGGGFYFRPNPLSAGLLAVSMNAGFFATPTGAAMFNTLRSAHQNNTKVTLWTSPATCPAYDLSVPGMTSIGDALAVIESFQ
jgi:hypothetical protein